MEIATLVVWAGGYMSLVFVAVCLATGLYYLAELVEEYTVLTKKLLGWAVAAELALYSLLLLWDGLPPLACASGLLAHALYGTLLRSFPFIRLSSPEFLASCGACVGRVSTRPFAPCRVPPVDDDATAPRSGLTRGCGGRMNMVRVRTFGS